MEAVILKSNAFSSEVHSVAFRIGSLQVLLSVFHFQRSRGHLRGLQLSSSASWVEGCISAGNNQVHAGVIRIVIIWVASVAVVNLALVGIVGLTTESQALDAVNIVTIEGGVVANVVSVVVWWIIIAIIPDSIGETVSRGGNAVKARFLVIGLAINSSTIVGKLAAKAVLSFDSSSESKDDLKLVHFY